MNFKPYTMLPVDDVELAKIRKEIRNKLAAENPGVEFVLRTFYLGPRSSAMWSQKSTAFAAKIAIYKREKHPRNYDLVNTLIGYYVEG